MIVAILIVTIYIFLLKIFEDPIIEEIKNAIDINDALKKRKELIALRRRSILIVIAMCIAVYFIQILIFRLEFYDTNLLIGLSSSIMFSLIIVSRRKSHNPLGTMSSLSKNEVNTNDEEFVLFLRGFIQDNYTPEIILKKQDFDVFSEYNFTKILSKYKRIYAVGMTKEIESPTGARRIYLSDTTWKFDVRELMEKSLFIVILLDDRESCLWEVEQSFDMLQKTIFIVDDVEKYTNVSTKIKHLIDFPKIKKEDLPNIMHFINYSKCNVESFSHNKSSYKKIIKIILHKFLGLSNRMPFKNTKVGSFCVKSLLLVTVLFISALSVRVFAYLTEFDGVVYATSLFLLFILYSITAIKFYKRYIRSDCFNQKLWAISKSINQN